jgi:hypothetical protein
VPDQLDRALRAKSKIKTSKKGSRKLSNQLYSIEEVITYAFTDPNFAEWLDTQATGPLEAQQEKTLWDTFKELIRKVVGTFGVKNKTLLDDLTDVLNIKLQKGVGALKMGDITTDSTTASATASPSQIAFDESQVGQTVSQTEEWIINNGVKGETYTLADGTKIEVVENNDQKVVIKKGPNLVTLGVEQKYDPNEKVTRGIMGDIVEKDANDIPLTTREYIIKLNNMHFYKTVKGQMKSSRTLMADSQNSFGIGKVKDFLSENIGDVEGMFTMMSETYLRAVLNGNPPGNLSALIDMTEGITQQEKEALFDTLGYANTTIVWAYITQADRVFGYKQMKDLRRIIQGNLTNYDSLVERAAKINFETMSERRRTFEVGIATDTVERAFNEMGLRVEGIRKMEGMREADFKKAMDAFGTFITARKDSTYNFLDSLIQLRTEFGELGITVDFGSLVRTRKGDNSNIVNQNEDNFLMEFDDAEMSATAMDDLSEGATFFLVKKENEDGGGMVEFDVANIGELTDETLETTNQINNLLESFDLEISAEYVQAYKLSNNEEIGGKRNGLYLR